MTDTTIQTTQPRTGMPIETRVPLDRKRQYAAGGPRRSFASLTQSLGPAIDAVMSELGPDIYERMGTDPQVRANLTALVSGILAHGYRIEPCEVPNDASDAERSLAADLHTMVEEQLTNLDTPLIDVLANLLEDGLKSGNKAAELVWTADGSAWRLTALRPKHRTRLAPVIDSFGAHIGYVVSRAGERPPVGALDGEKLAEQSSFVPREKFLAFVNDPHDDDPRGTSLLRSAYQPWWIKQQLYPEWLKYLSQFAVPSLIAELAPDDALAAGTRLGALEDAADTDKDAQELLDTLLQWANATAIVVPSGTKITIADVSKEGGATFAAASAHCDQQITLAMLAQLLATGTVAHQTNASTATHQDVLDDVIAGIKARLEQAVRRDVIKRIVTYNRGAAAARYAPRISLGQVEQQDFASMATAIAALKSSDYLHRSQLAEIDLMLNIPVRAAEVDSADPTGAPQPGSDWPLGEPTTEANSEPAADIQQRATALGSFIRAGYHPDDARLAAGVPQMRHSGGRPITLKQDEG